MAFRNFEDEMRQFEAEIGGKSGGIIGTNTFGAVQRQLGAPPVHFLPAQLNRMPMNRVPPPPQHFPPPNMLAASAISAGLAASADPTPPPAMFASMPKTYSAPPQTIGSQKDDDDILATLQKYEKEVKTETSDKKRKDKKIKAKTSFKPTAVTAQEISSKAKQMVAEAKKTTMVTMTKPQAPGSMKVNVIGNSSMSDRAIVPPPSATINDDAVRKAKKQRKMIRTAGGQIWEDPSLQEWDPNDFRLFCGDLGNDVTDEVLTRAFSRFASFVKAKVIRDKKSNKTKGYGFVSFRDPLDFTRALREMNGKYVGSRPIKLRKSNWKDRNIDIVKHKQKVKQSMGYKW